MSFSTGEYYAAIKNHKEALYILIEKCLQGIYFNYFLR